jgi:hypothetical protein
MNRVAPRNEPQRLTDVDRVVEPLASYICATERPKAALKTVVAALLRSVEETNWAAKNHFLHVVKGAAS